MIDLSQESNKIYLTPNDRKLIQNETPTKHHYKTFSPQHHKSPNNGINLKRQRQKQVQEASTKNGYSQHVKEIRPPNHHSIRHIGFKYSFSVIFFLLLPLLEEKSQLTENSSQSKKRPPKSNKRRALYHHLGNIMRRTEVGFTRHYATELYALYVGSPQCILVSTIAQRLSSGPRCHKSYKSS
ncbi:hypothetical protein TNCV_535891 [Trichonephila clavipes]|nr:hypothetical protein TNCV_535891 [Trichonephila clavipes]